MSTEAFAPYDLPGIGTVVAHDAGSYCVLEADGQVHGYPAPGGICSPDTASADIAAARAALWQAPAALVYAEHLDAGYTDAATGIVLKTTEYAQQKFTSAVALARLALVTGVITNDTPQTFWDAANQSHTLSTADFLSLMLRYGVFCQTLFNDYAP